ncbi:prolow-density lipoprotein receptor-related protein 1-like [Sergentomyia squamirostris]
MEKNKISFVCFDFYVKLCKKVNFIGFDLFDENQPSPNYKTYITLILDAILLTMSISSIYQFRDDMLKLTTTVLTLGLAIHAAAKMFIAVVFVKEFQDMMYAVKDFIIDFDDNSKVYCIFEKYIGFCNWCKTNLIIAYNIMVLGLLIFSFAASLWTKTKHLPFGAVLPFIDYESDTGFVINFAIYMAVFVWGIFGFFVSDCAHLAFMAMACGQVETIGIACSDLTEYLEQAEPYNISELKRLLKIIIKSQQKHNNFMKRIDENYGIETILIVASSMGCIALAMFVLIKEVWLSGIIMSGYCLWQIFFVCIMGGVYIMTVDQVAAEVYGTKWYYLPCPMQKMFINILQNIQNLKEPSALGFFYLNFNTFALMGKHWNFILTLLLVLQLRIQLGHACRISEFSCRGPNGLCLPLDKYCDGKDDCGDGSDEPKFCTVCNRTYYGDVGRTYALRVPPPQWSRLPFLCHLTFTASGHDQGDIVQIIFDGFSVGRFDEGLVDGEGDTMETSLSPSGELPGCPEGFMQLSELGRPFTGGSWCGSASGHQLYYSETSTVTVSVKVSEQSSKDKKKYRYMLPGDNPNSATREPYLSSCRR